MVPGSFLKVARARGELPTGASFGEGTAAAKKCISTRQGAITGREAGLTGWPSCPHCSPLILGDSTRHVAADREWMPGHALSPSTVYAGVTLVYQAHFEMVGGCRSPDRVQVSGEGVARHL